jgi:hypothetical protein
VSNVIDYREAKTKKQLSGLKSDPIQDLLITPIAEQGLDPRITRTADAMFEADRMMSSLEKAFDEHFPDGPEAA